MQQFSKDVVELIGSIPAGKVSTYGHIAKSCGHPRGARQVSRLIYTMTKKFDLPWWRVISSQGKSSIHQAEGRAKQQFLLEEEGVVFDGDTVDLEKYLYP